MTFQEAFKKLIEGDFNEIMLREAGLYLTWVDGDIDFAPKSRRYINSVDIDDKNWDGINYEWVKKQVKIEPLPIDYKPGANIYV